MKIKALILALIHCLLSFNSQAQEWPKLMKLFDGKIIDIHYRGDSGFFCMDYTGKRIPCLEMNHIDNNAAKYLYVDSTGSPINNERYDYAEPFKGGVAAVWGPKTNPQTYAIINAKAEFVSAFSEENKFAIGHGLFVIDKKNSKEVYNREGKLVTECSACWVRFFDGKKNMIVGPSNQNSETAIIKMLDPDGKELFRSRGQNITDLMNTNANGRFTPPQPYYMLQVDGTKNHYAVLSDDGKIVLDSVESFSFYQGIALIKKNKLASMIDTNFKTLMPFSYGYDHYMPYYKHPQGAYCARKKGKYMVIDTLGKQLIPVTSTVTYISYRYDLNMYELRAPDMWFMSLAGDTIVSPYKYTVKMPLYPDAPGFLVTRKNGVLMGYISEKGKMIIPCNYDQLAFGGKDLFLFFKDNKSGYMDMQGNPRFNIEGAIKLSSFYQGYALCSVGVTDINKYSPSAQSVSSDKGSYQVQNRLIDSTGKFVSDESFDWLFLMKDGYAKVIKNGNAFMVDRNLNKIVINGDCQMMTYFYKGYALICNPDKKTWGLINKKMEIVVPAIYDKIYTKEDERRYGYQLFSKLGDDRSPGCSNYYANIWKGKLKVLLNGKEEYLSVADPGSK